MNFDVRVASTGNLTASDMEVGDTIDGVVLGPYDLILLKDQTVAAENGIYVAVAVGAPLRVRAADAESGDLLTGGSPVYVREGTANGGKNFVLSKPPDPLTIGKTSLTFVEPTISTAIADNAVTNAKLRDSGPLSVVGRAANSTGDPADISAVAASAAVLRESGSTLGFGAILEASVTGLVADLAAKAPTARILTAGSGLTGGGDLTADRTFDVGVTAPITVAADTVGISITTTNDGGAVVKQAATPGTAQTGHANITGKAKAGQLEAVAAAGGDIALLLRGGATPSADIAQFQINVGSAIRSRIDLDGSLKTDEALRVAPWIEPEVLCTVNTTIDTTTSTDITGATVTFTPKSDCRVQVTAFFDIFATAIVSSDVFVGELKVNGVAEGEAAIWGALAGIAGSRIMVGQVWNFLLTGGTSYTIKLAARLVTDNGSVYTVSATHTKFSLLAVGRF